MNKFFLMTVFLCLLTFAIDRYIKKKRKPSPKRLNELREIIATAKPYVVPDTKEVEKIQSPIVNRRQRRAMDKIKKKGEKRYAGKNFRDEVRSGKIIESNEFLKKYFDGK